MKIRFQADADLRHAIIAGVLRRAAGVDFQRAEAISLEGLHDQQVLALAADEGRVLVSHDQNTMEGYFREFIRTRNSPGLILIPQRRVSIGRAIESLVLTRDVLEAGDLENRVCLFHSLVIC